jgi:hypothetical protein
LAGAQIHSGGAKKKSHDGATPRDTSPRIATMSTLPDSSMPDPNEPTFDPGLDVAILVFSHVEHVKTRLNLALVSKLWLEAFSQDGGWKRSFMPDSTFATYLSMAKREARAIISVLGRSKDPRIIVPEIETLTRSILVRSVEEYNNFWSGREKA